MSRTRRPRWGILGAGGIAGVFADALMDRKATVTAIASRTREPAEALAARVGGASVYEGPERLLDSGAVDIVYIASTNETHFPLARSALDRGLAVLCEKPLAVNLDQVESLATLARKRNTLLIEALWTAFLPSFAVLRERLEMAEIGEVQFVRSDFGFFVPFDPNLRLFDADRGGGCLLDLGPYVMLLATTALGDPVDAQVYARLGPTGVDHHVAATLHFGRERVAQFLCSFELPTLQSAELYGSAGMITLDPPFWHSDRFSLRHRTAGGPRPESPYLHSTPRIEQMPQPSYVPEIDEAERCWDLGLVESPMMPHAASIRIARALDLVRRRLPPASVARAGS